MRRFNLTISILFLFVVASRCGFAQVASNVLSAATIARLERVPEFAYIRELAQQYGIKVYLFGGTAAAFGHYVRWDLEREAGDDKYQPERFDYDFTNIYRGNQDLDIVLDTDAETAKKFQAELQAKFPHFQGDKEGWEVRTLRTSIGEKSPLLNDYDFLNQHTDSNSTGLIDISQLDPSQQAYFDLRDWQNPNSQFLNDIASGTITYHYSAKHGSTSRYRQGMNPSILSAVRYLAKLTQYEVIGRPEDLERVKTIISQTNFNQLSGYALEKVAQFSLKALLNSPDVEYAWNLLDETGLRKKLLETFRAYQSTPNSVAWWMNKEPLRSFELGRGSGKTATEMGVDVVSHETTDLQAYENIVRSAKGRANVFISRDGTSGEEAYSCNGFCVGIGSVGGKNTGITARFHLHPEARQGSDFKTAAMGAVGLVILNKNALRLIPESAAITLPQYLKLILDGKIDYDHDKGLVFKMERKFARNPPSDSEIEQAAQELRDLPYNQSSAVALRVWLSLKASSQYPEIVNSFLHKGQQWKTALKDFTWISEYVRTTDEFVQGRSDELLSPSKIGALVRYITFSPEFFNNLEFVEPLFQVNGIGDKFVEVVSTRIDWTQHVDFIENLIQRGINVEPIIQFILSKPYWTAQPHLIQEIIQKGGYDDALAKYIFSQPDWASHPEMLQELISRCDKTACKTIADDVLSKPYWINNSSLVESLLQRKLADLTIAYSILSQPVYVNHPAWVKEIIDRADQRTAGAVAEYVLAKEFWTAHPELVQYLIDRHVADGAVAREVLSKPYWAAMPQYDRWVQEIIDHFDPQKNGYDDMIQFSLGLLKEPLSTARPEWLVDLVVLASKPVHGWSSNVMYSIAGALQSPIWQNNSLLGSYLGGKELNVHNIVERNSQLPFREWLKTRRLTRGNSSAVESCAEILVAS